MLPSVKENAWRIYRGIRSFQTPNPDWASLIEPDKSRWQAAVQAAKGGQRVLIATSNGRQPAFTSIESIVAVALTLRGAEVHFLLCDHFLPACLESTIYHTIESSFAKHGPQSSLCDSCFRAGKKSYDPLCLPLHRYSECVTAEQQVQAQKTANATSLAEIPTFQVDDLAIGEHALAGALRYFVRGSLENEPNGEIVLRRYFHAALLTAYATQNLITQYQFDVLCFNHGIYIPQGIIGEVARKRNVRVVNWNAAYRKQRFIFTHNDTYHHQMMSESLAAWQNLTWTSRMEKQVMDYLKSRWEGSQDWIWFHENPKFNLDEIAAELGIDPAKPTIGMLTNVIWDAQLHYPANAFANMLEWVIKTIEYFIQRPDLQLIIRVHPAEIHGVLKSRQPMVDEIKRVFPHLPPNIIVIPPESAVSTYTVMMPCDSVIIYGTKTGVELTSMGIPVIVAGEAWIRNKGLTIDASSIAEYFEILSQLPLQKRMDEAQIQQARKYAYHFFFRRMIPLEFMQPTKGRSLYSANITSLDDLLPGKHAGLDVICDGILNGSEFIYPAEKFDAE